MDKKLIKREMQDVFELVSWAMEDLDRERPDLAEQELLNAKEAIDSALEMMKRKETE